MVWSPGNMGKTNEGMWNSSTHAMSDISALAYRKNVPASELIVPAEVPGTDQTFEHTRNKSFQSNFADVSWNKLGNGRGRGALLQNRDVVHRNDQELNKQLRFANGLGYSNLLIEAKYQNSSPPRSLEEEETGGNTYTDDDLQRSPPVGNKTLTTGGTTAKESPEEEDVSIKANGEWNWERRTSNPAPNRVILKNVALESLKRQKQKAKPVKEVKAASEVATPVVQESYPNVVKVKEDWRAEIKAKEEEARKSQAAEADVLITSPKAKKGWRSEPREPLLGDLQINSNWSVFAPNVATLVTEDTPTPEPEPSVAPPGYLMPTNGVSPMAVRNSEYNPLAGQNHRTFGNLFGQTIKQLGTNNRRPYKTSGSFTLTKDEFPQLK